MAKLFITLVLITGLTFISCKESFPKHNKIKQGTGSENSNKDSIDSSIIYQTHNLMIKRLSNHIYEHISYKNTDDFGKVACNGMLIVNENEGFLFDTPADDKSSLELINFITKNLHCRIKALVPTHFHDDSTGGIAEFEKHYIPTYATIETIELLKNKGQNFSKTIKGFTDSLTLTIGNKKVFMEYFGEGHTKDNIIGYFPEDNAIFGGCLIKEIGANKGYLGDANTDEWSETVRKIKLKYPNVEIVIPGHGKWGGNELLDYTIELFE